MYDKLWLIPFFPLVGSIINGLLGKRFIKNEKIIGAIGTGAIFLSFLVSCKFFYQLVNDSVKIHETVVASWMSVGNLQVDWGFLLDPLSAVMFIGWEGVGLCSYLLIGYYFEKQSAGDAAKKAFVMNRVGDFGFLLGLFTIFWTLGSKHGVWTINFVEISEKAHLLSGDMILGAGVTTVATLCFFLGATGKSAQLPLFTWLPDAMEGPPPVSALIHAATMVTAGVYMIGRMNVLFAMSPTTMMVVAVVGALTAIFAATIGFAQNDIKRVLAYSTVSQLGFIFVAMGVGAFTAGIFHLMTHAFFKACLFLGSGSVIHAMHHALHHAHLDDDAQDMRNMGGLRKKMPITWATFGISCLAISGLPFFSGFFSKDEILWWAFSSTHGSKLVWIIVVVAAFMTAFYMFRCLYMTFYGEQKTNPKAKDHVHESPWVITLPLVVLAGLATVGGLIGIPHVIDIAHVGNKLNAFLARVFGHSQGLYKIEAHGSASTEIILMVFSVAVALAGIGLATVMYMKDPSLPGKFTAKFSTLHRAVFNKWYVDEIYDTLFVNTTKKLGIFCWRGFDVKVVDGIVNGVAKLVGSLSSVLRYTQSGLFQNYALTMVLGTVVMLAIFILK